MSRSYEGTAIDPHLELVAVADEAWRVSDGRIPHDDARRILGVIERRGDCYEVMWLCAGGAAAGEFTCIAEALAAASERMRRLSGSDDRDLRAGALSGSASIAFSGAGRRRRPVG